jgi:pyrroloquinoline quinone biosynthesis protein D
MSEQPTITLEQIPAVAKLFRLQWEEAQQAHVLLYPEGMVKLNGPAGEIMKRVDGKKSVGDIAHDLETTFNEPDLKKDVLGFMEIAHERGWIRF